MNLEWIVKDGEKFILAVNADITDFIEQTEDRIIPPNSKTIPEMKVIENDDNL